MQIRGLIPTATATEIWLDKIHAFPHRAYLKYRDVYDLWWLRHYELAEVDCTQLAPRFDYHRELYNSTQPKDLAAKIRARAAQMTSEGLRHELFAHLPVALFGAYTDKKCAEIVDFVRTDLEHFIEHYERHHGLRAWPADDLVISP